MTDYRSILSARRQLFTVVEEALSDVGHHRFIQQSVAYRLRNCLGHWFRQPVEFTVDTDELAFDYNPFREEVLEVRFDGVTFDLRNPGDSGVPLLDDYPEALDGIGSAIIDLWTDTFETECPYAVQLRRATETFGDSITRVRSTASLDQVVRALRNDQEEVIELLFDVEQPIADQDDSELAAVVDQSTETVLYQDEDLALLLPEPQVERTWRGGIFSIQRRPREAFVVGRDTVPAGFFVHSVDATHLTATSNVTRDDIHEAMGFDRELSFETSVLDPSPNERVRVQGDLCLERTRTDRELRDWFASQHRDDVERVVTEELSDRFFRKRNLAGYRDQIQIAGHGSDVQVDIERSNRGAEVVAAIEQQLVRTHRWQPRQKSGHSVRYQWATQRLERRLSNYFAANDQEYTETVERRVSDRVREALDPSGQLNLPIDNHLVLLGSGRLHPDEAAEREPVRIVVPDQTSLHVVHDEHPQVDVQLTPGEYVFQLLDRGIQPESERPTW